MSEMGKALLVILNKDNAEKLERCITSLLSQTAKLSKDFDILILDGGSKDNSRDVAMRFSKRYNGIYFKVQEVIGGTGFARREACEYALKKGYKFIIWGDSENVYDKSYVEKMLEKLEDCDLVGGIPKVRGGFFAHAFAWYHAIHLIFPRIYRVHIPGNNKGERTEIYRVVSYPESIRADDYGFSLALIKKLIKNKIKIKSCIANSFVIVSLPESIKDVHRWQINRAKGVAQALKIVNFKPYDVIGWSSIFLFLIVLLSLTIINYTHLLLLYLLFLFTLSIVIFIRSKDYIEKPKYIYFFTPFIGLLIHSIYSIYALIHYLRWSYEK